MDEWPPAKDWTREQVRGLHDEKGLDYHWCYDSEPGAGNRLRTTHCSCSNCFLASRRDSLIGAARRPRAAALIAHVEEVRGDSFRPDIRMRDLIELSRRPDAPRPGVVIEDEGPGFDRMERRVLEALRLEPRRLSRLSVSAPPRELRPVSIA
ncbi:hypothetical protein F7Q99_36310 [Streptomyces kaniharaensis]|uniref:Uncharacterized protein n=1 Tax=Streptomyces kaniharaensis TaxID=212423 RepID=A0A6N7L3W5_9ACTN|nr:hypothetical protein [Streptomyces kaniharaensis]MQS17507.1 hypothetical protein [Streptomyces kaniharaensis]